MRLALRLARRAYGRTSPNPMVGAVLVKGGKIIGRGWHRAAGQPHAEIQAIRDAQRGGHNPKGATLYVTLEPCSTQGRTPPCTQALIAAGIRRVVAGATDPNPLHAGRGFRILRRAGLSVTRGVQAGECLRLNEAFNHWIVRRTPFVTVKAAMSLDGKIATVAGESKWITSPPARALAMKLRAGADAVLVGVNTIVKDDPRLTVRLPGFAAKPLRRIVLDPRGRTPLAARILSGPRAPMTTIVVTKSAPPKRLAALRRRVRVLVAPARRGRIDLPWLLHSLGRENITSLLVEGGGETNALWAPLCQRIVFFYAPLILGGRDAPTAVAGDGALAPGGKLTLRDARWRRVGADLLLIARVNRPE
ncbi:MAG TPA: bifunctional diaminohydroxyphosphoribosylaminopyrimidine deaminase/5-amino-6-(5-phosphoribosylamino)uracil reductase RibD [Candidatus Acidoferrum sp.]|nr:bifunctional diaminohydroxyphosphoribosylaminopyrimidine deaminase/5-amino-6-(5-phosphoribosylamino)uracil reductase RibD [Candidatus Acidoferrum sp.]